VAYHSNIRALVEIIRRVVASHPQVISGDDLPIEERPDCEIDSFGDSGINMFVEFLMEGIDDGRNRVGGDLRLMILGRCKSTSSRSRFPGARCVCSMTHRLSNHPAIDRALKYDRPPSKQHDSRNAIEHKDAQRESTDTEQLHVSNDQWDRPLAEFVMPPPREKQQRYGSHDDEPSKELEQVRVPHRRREDDHRSTRDQAQGLFCVVGLCRTCKGPEKTRGSMRCDRNQSSQPD
jgi:hypothetical protein